MESLNDEIMQLKRKINILIKENDKLKVIAQKSREDCNKKNQLLQSLIGQSKSSGNGNPSQNHVNAALIISLKEQIRELEADNKKYATENKIMKKDLQLTKKYEIEDANKAYEEECKRLRILLDEFSDNYNNKKINIKYEERIQEQRSYIKELNERIRELSIELERSKEAENQLKENYKNAKIKNKLSNKRKEKLRRQKIVIEEAKERIAILLNENKRLEGRLQEQPQVKIETILKGDIQLAKTPKNVVDELRSENERLRIEKENTKQISEYNAKQLFEKEKELRVVRTTAREREDEYVLKGLEEKERLTKRIVRLELQLKAMSKEPSPEDFNKPPAPAPAPVPGSSGLIREVTNPRVQDIDIAYTKQLLRIVLINEEIRFDTLKKDIFDGYEPDEKISIKELGKILKKKPLILPTKQAENFARFLIEPR